MPKGVYMKKLVRIRTGNKGVTLIELIVVIAIMTTLTGLLVPQFMKYVADKRKTACEENREAIVNICEKIVYSGVPLSDLTTCVSTVAAGAAYTSIPDEYQEALRSHWECPDGGKMQVTVQNGIIICECCIDSGGTLIPNPEHERQVVADMVTWSGAEIETYDPNFDIPEYIPGPEPETPSGETPSGHTPSGHSSIVDTYWPYPNHRDWQDPSKVVGGTGASNPALYISVPSGKFPMRNSNGTYAYYVAIDKNGTHSLKIDNMYAASPQLYLNGPNNEGVIACNGTEYTEESIKAAAGNYPGLLESGTSTKPFDEQKYSIAGGTIYFNGVHRYIYFHQGQEYTVLPTVTNTASDVNKCGNWYLMKDTDELK